MKCPACPNTLQEMTAGDVQVDICKNGCGGIWFESEGEALLEIERDKNLVIDRTKRLNCPKCDNIVMMRHFFSIKKEVQVDECPGCGGFWLDAGELGKIRSLFETEQERHDAAEQYFAEIFGDKLKAMTAENEAKLQKASKISNMFRFICPSNYIPGKQDWGAF